MIYLITDGTYTKIGYTTGTIKTRLKSLQTGNARRLHVVAQLEVPNCAKIEALLHINYKAFYILNEWYQLKPIIVKNMIRRFKFTEYSYTEDDENYELATDILYPDWKPR